MKILREDKKGKECEAGGGKQEVCQEEQKRCDKRTQVTNCHLREKLKSLSKAPPVFHTWD